MSVDSSLDREELSFILFYFILFCVFIWRSGGQPPQVFRAT